MVATYRYFLYSLGLHVILFAAFFVSFKRSSVGNQSFHMVHAYLFNAHKHGEHKAPNTPSKIKHIRHAKLKDGMSVTQHTKSASAPAHSASKLLSAGVHSFLLEQLHDAVATQLIYPSEAAFLNVSGTAVVSFQLSPSGEINHIQVMHSSHSAALDQAAIAALRAIAPFALAKKYLTSVQRFTIPIEFKN